MYTLRDMSAGSYFMHWQSACIEIDTERMAETLEIWWIKRELDRQHLYSVFYFDSPMP